MPGAHTDLSEVRHEDDVASGDSSRATTAAKSREGRRIVAARALRELSLPVETVDAMNRQATPDLARLLP